MLRKKGGVGGGGGGGGGGGEVVFLETLFSFDNDDGDILNNVDNRFSPTSTKTVPKLSIAGHTKFFYFNCSEEKTQSEFGQ